MAKKKKTSSKPAARPIATTPIAMKPREEPAVKVENDGALDTTRTTANIARSELRPKEHDTERVGIKSLQLLVDQEQAKAEREILRTMKVLEQDRRTSRSLPLADIDPIIRGRILDMVKTAEPASKLIQEPKDKVLPRLAATYGTLRGLGFSEERIEECLRAISDAELGSAIEWLYLNREEDELEFGNQFNDWEMDPKDLPASDAAEDLHEPKPALSPIMTITSEPEHLIAVADLDFEDEDAPTVDVNAKWARTKVAIHMLKFVKPKSFKLDPSDPHVQKLESKLRALESDYEFRKKHAEYTFQELRKTAEANELERTLRMPKADISRAKSQKSDHKPLSDEKVQVPIPPAMAATAIAPASTNAIEDYSDEECGFFGHLLDEMPTEVTTSAGETVRVYELEFPKNWNASTPKSLLKDYVAKMDRYAIISYRSIGGVTRVARAAVQIRWRGRPGQEWIIPDACPTLIQAEHYAAIFALHSLSCPVRAGFVGLRSSVTPVQPSSIRSLPPRVQDLWKEFEVRRKKEEDETNRRVWGNLRAIVEPKLAPPRTCKEAQPMKPVAMGEQNDVITSKPAPPLKELPNLKADYEARKSSPAYQEMLQKRNELPIAAFRSRILESLRDHQVIVLSGETGCGKSTQLPAYILEDQMSRGIPCKIYCTEPRRISAISLAQRVSRELGDSPNAVGTLSSLIGYSVRFENHITQNTRLAFITDGIALRMLESGSGCGSKGTAFDEITHIIIDEVHERSIESDFLLIVIKSLLHQRPNLKAVLMSATIDTEKISAYFGGPSVCPILVVPGRLFPVAVQFLEDAIELTKWVLNDDSPYTRKSKFSSSGKSKRLEWSEETAPAENDDDDGESSTAPVKLGNLYSVSTISTINRLDQRRIPYELVLKLLENICLGDLPHSRYSAAVLVFMPGLSEIRHLIYMLRSHSDFGTQAFKIYPLHSALSSEDQTAVFDIPPAGVRKIVISTNIAETGVTIPDITCVIDTGKHKEMRFDEKRQTSRLIETTIARSNAAQRRGRAGRVQEGLCFHLFTKSHYDNLMVDSSRPEMLRASLAGLALRTKIMSLQIGNSVEDVLSKALDPPSSNNIQRAVNALIEVKALTTTEQITNLGRLLSQLPMDVHLGKFLLHSVVLGCLDAALTICATLNAKSPFLRPLGYESQARVAKASFSEEHSDFLALHNAFASWKRASANGQQASRKFCREAYLSYQNLQEIEDLRRQFMGYLIDSSYLSVDPSFSQEFDRIRSQRQRANFMELPESLSPLYANTGLIQAALTAGLFPKLIHVDPSSGQMQTISNNRMVSFHPSSVNFRRAAHGLGSTYFCYFSLTQSKKLYAPETGPCDDLALILLCGDCEFKPASELVIVDRKIKYRVPGKTAVALKALRSRLASNMALRLRTRQSELNSETDAWTAIAIELFSGAAKS